MSDDYAPQRVGHASLLGPTAPLVTELLQLPHLGVPAVTKDIFVWIVGPRRRLEIILLTYLLTYLLSVKS